MPQAMSSKEAQWPHVPRAYCLQHTFYAVEVSDYIETVHAPKSSQCRDKHNDWIREEE